MRYERNEELERIVWDIVAQEEDFIDIRVTEPRICVLNCDQKKMSEGRLVYADICSVPDKYKALAEFDYIITVYEDNASLLSDQGIRILLEHELRHINIKCTTKGINFGIIGHDIEDFYAIIDKYGIDWSTAYA